LSTSQREKALASWARHLRAAASGRGHSRSRGGCGRGVGRCGRGRAGRGRGGVAGDFEAEIEVGNGISEGGESEGTDVPSDEVAPVFDDWEKELLQPHADQSPVCEGGGHATPVLGNGAATPVAGGNEGTEAPRSPQLPLPPPVQRPPKQLDGMCLSASGVRVAIVVVFRFGRPEFQVLHIAVPSRPPKPSERTRTQPRF